MKTITYPYTPRTATRLLPGEFWAITLSDGSFACGCVIESEPPGPVRSRTIFLGALLDWHASSPPTVQTIAGKPCLHQARIHLKAITDSASQILGQRDQTRDAIPPWEFRGSQSHRNSYVHLGLRRLRPQTPKDAHLPVFVSDDYFALTRIAQAKWGS